MTDYSVGGYSLRKGGANPFFMQVPGGDWMNPFYTCCFPTPGMMGYMTQQDTPNVDYYRGTPVREANKPHTAIPTTAIPTTAIPTTTSIASIDMETSNNNNNNNNNNTSVKSIAVTKPKANIPRSTRALRRMDAFTNRCDWGALPVMSIAPIDAELHTNLVSAPMPIAASRNNSSLWPTKPTTREQWRALPPNAIKAPKALLAVGDSGDESDHSNNNNEDVDDDKWLTELQSTINRAFAEDTSSSTESLFHFEWSTIAKQMDLQKNLGDF